MKNCNIPNWRLNLVAASCLILTSVGASASNFERIEAHSSGITKLESPRYVVADKGAVSEHTKEDRFLIIQLEHDPIVSYAGDIHGYAATRYHPHGRTRDVVSSNAAASYRQFLLNEQAAVFNTLQSTIPGIELVSSTQGVMNSLTVLVPSANGKSLHEIAQLPGVKAVFRNERVYPAMDTSNSLINAAEAWDMAGGRDTAGEGVRIAIIDSGILSDHPMFAANGHTRPADIRTNDYCGTVDETFCNDKLIIARSYPPSAANLHSSEVTTPYDIDGHGSHVAGTAAGNLVSTTFNSVALSFSGVAPGASLMAYKALFLGPDGRTSGFTNQLLTALEDAYLDGADIINNSWGSGPGNNPAASAYATALSALEAQGVLVVNAAGNSGPDSQSIICPACVEPGIAVANTLTGRTFGAPVLAAGISAVGILGDGDFVISEPITAPLGILNQISPTNTLACNPITNNASITGRIIMVDRGTCTFAQKAQNLQSAGAVGMIVANNENGTIAMNMPNATLPSVSVERATGQQIRVNYRLGDEATINGAQAIINTALADTMATFSSRGPNGDSAILKPELAAPGTNILSAYPTATGPGYGAISGTSMASPHVAGAAALLRQLRPELSAFELKSVLITSANPNVRTRDDYTDPASPFDMGAGRLDIAAALGTAIAFDKPSMATPNCAPTCSFTRTISNLMTETTDWLVTFEPFDLGLDLVLETTEITIAGGESVELEIGIDTTFAGNSGWNFGHLVFTDLNGNYSNAIIPFAVSAMNNQDNDVVSSFVTMGGIELGNDIDIETRINGANLKGEVKAVLTLPANAQFVPNALDINQTNATTASFSIADDNRSITWVGEFDQIEPTTSLNAANLPSFGSSSFNGLSLEDILVNSPPKEDCSSVCDDQGFILDVEDVGGFSYLGVTHNTIIVSPNGFITPGTQNHAGSFEPQVMPNTTPPNNVLAPLWADFVIGGSFGGNIAYASFDFDDEIWLVIEWQDVRECVGVNSQGECSSASSNSYSFALWHNATTQESFFNYIDIPSAMPATFTIGFENLAGTQGFTRTTAVASGNVLKPSLVSADSFVHIRYQATPGLMGAAPALSVEGTPNQAVTLALTDGFTPTPARALGNVTVANDGVSYEAFVPVVTPAGETFSASVVSQPSVGSVAVVDGELVFTPAAGRSGDFTFEYRIEDEVGRFTTPGEVTVSVTNSAPVAAASASATSARAGTSVNLSAAGSSDPDGDPLTYSWVQVSGPTAEMRNTSSATASFIAPRSNSAATLSFRVTVNDGELSSTATVNVALERYSSKKWYEGSFGAFIVLLGLPLVWIRRRQFA